MSVGCGGGLGGNHVVSLVFHSRRTKFGLLLAGRSKKVEVVGIHCVNFRIVSVLGSVYLHGLMANEGCEQRITL